MSTTSEVGKGAEVSRDDIEAKLREIRGDVDELGESTRSVAGVVIVAAVVAVIALTYFLGKRKGKKKTTVVEVRRV
ncbi:MAG: hypothetical protein H0U89_05510 [Acidimicrobiia bacterium]|nr:hypothetical protein [Acidimicrobiia bacterium]